MKSFESVLGSLESIPSALSGESEPGNQPEIWTGTGGGGANPLGSGAFSTRSGQPVYISDRHAGLEPELEAFRTEYGARARERIKVLGVEALGWYSPFHRTAQEWGIYISTAGVLALAALAFNETPIAAADKLKIASRAIYLHEWNHFAVEYAVSQMEIVRQEAAYLAIRDEHADQGSDFTTIQEQLASAAMLLSIRSQAKKQGAYDSLIEVVKTMPAGYRDAIGILTNRRFEETLHRVLFQYSLGFMDVGPHFDGLDFPLLLPTLSKSNEGYCPVYYVNDHAAVAASIRFIQSVSNLSESSMFMKQLDRMGREVKGRWETCKRKMADSVSRGGLDFKPWPQAGEGVFSVRVDRSNRAHLRHEGQGNWIALEIGSHDAMKH